MIGINAIQSLVFAVLCALGGFSWGRIHSDFASIICAIVGFPIGYFTGLLFSSAVDGIGNFGLKISEKKPRLRNAAMIFGVVLILTFWVAMLYGFVILFQPLLRGRD